MLRLALFVLFLASTIETVPLKWQLGRGLFTEEIQNQEEWMAFKMKYNKIYKSHDEHMTRRQTFMENLAFIKAHNKLHSEGLSTFTVGINEFADMDSNEFNAAMNGFKLNNNSNVEELHLNYETTELPSSVDWRTSGCVTGVKNQGRCGSCWAFSVTGCLEALFCLAKQTPVSLSEQQLVDCSTRNHGCKGGSPPLAYEYIKDNKGIDSEQSYPYTAKQGRCRFRSEYVAAYVSGVYGVKQSEKALQTLVAKIGPISVGIDASRKSFQLYKEGVYNDPTCSSTQLDHGVLAVGYGSDYSSGDDYWIVKNSWGPAWGEKGYIRMSRNKDNQCGIATAATFPSVP